MPGLNFQSFEFPILTTRILFYGDYSQTHLRAIPNELRGSNLRRTDFEFGLSIVKDILESNFIPKIEVTFINRFWELDANGIPQKKEVFTPLTSYLLKEYDQIWFFGQHLGSFNPGDENTVGNDNNGYPESTLFPEELNALKTWMNEGGGVLITGDHSNYPTIGDTTVLWDLGRAMGKDIWRAGKMRVWEGPPGAYTDVVNTSGDTLDMTWMPNQADSIPQGIYPIFWDYKLTRIWHPLFAGSGIPGIIQILPDHGHEGKLQIPTTFDISEWPRNNIYQPKPIIVATGINKQNGQPINLVSAYDGQSAGVGRIVAHSTWHHFVNVNLNGFTNQGDIESDTFQTLSQYFTNLAWYLHPAPKRRLAFQLIIKKLIHTSNMRDLHKAPLNLIGQAANLQLNEIFTKGQVEDFVNLAISEVIISKENQTSSQAYIPLENFLGGIIAEQQESMYRENGDENVKYNNIQDRILFHGVSRAIKDRLIEIEKEVQTHNKNIFPIPASTLEKGDAVQ